MAMDRHQRMEMLRMQSRRFDFNNVFFFRRDALMLWSHRVILEPVQHLIYMTQRQLAPLCCCCTPKFTRRFRAYIACAHRWETIHHPSGICLYVADIDDG